MPRPSRVVPKAKRIARLKKACDAAWSLAVRKRDGSCQMCGDKENLHAHHWHTQKARSLALRWDLRNGVTLCYACHMFKVHQYAVWSDLAPLFVMLTNRLGPSALIDMAIESETPTTSWCTEEWLTTKRGELKAA